MTASISCYLIALFADKLRLSIRCILNDAENCGISEQDYRMKQSFVPIAVKHLIQKIAEMTRTGYRHNHTRTAVSSKLGGVRQEDIHYTHPHTLTNIQFRALYRKMVQQIARPLIQYNGGCRADVGADAL